MTLPTGLCAVAAALLFLQASTASATCVAPGPQRADLPRVAREAVELLRSAGHDPADYELELSQNDRFSSEGQGWTVEFRPRRPELHYPLGVRMEQPCLLRWLEGAVAHPLQLELLGRVREMTQTQGIATWKELSIFENARWIGVELHFDAAEPPNVVWKALFDRTNLSVLEAGRATIGNGVR